MEVTVGLPVVSTHFDDEVVVSELSAEISSTKEQGYFTADTRLVSGYRLKLGGKRPILLNGAATRPHSARFELTNPTLVGSDGNDIPEHALHLRLDRTVGPGVHEDYDLTNQSRGSVALDLDVSVESDFADLFDVVAIGPVQVVDLQRALPGTSQTVSRGSCNRLLRSAKTVGRALQIWNVAMRSS